MITHDEDRIRDRAYGLWQHAGSPDGRDLEFWRQAERELAEEGGLDLSEEDAEVRRPTPPAGALVQ